MPQSRGFRALVFATCLAAGGIFWGTGRLAPLYFTHLIPAQPTAPRVLGDGMIAEIQAMPVEGLTENLSGLTYSAHTGTLFAVINRPPEVAELSLDGRLLRKFALPKAVDPEGITHVSGDGFILSDEKDQSLHWVTIGPDTTALDVAANRRIQLGIDARNNMGLEGVAWDSVGGRLFAVQEMLPQRLFTFDGLGAALTPVMPYIGEQALPWLQRLVMLDLSAVWFNQSTRTLLLLSHMSAVAVEFDAAGAPIGMLSLWQGEHGLDHTIAQAEGLAADPDGRVYLVAEPNLFYRFAPPDAPAIPAGNES